MGNNIVADDDCSSFTRRVVNESLLSNKNTILVAIAINSDV